MTRNNSFYKLAVFTAIAMLSIQAAHAQVVGATLSGTVTDPSAAVIPGAKVTIRNISTGVASQVTTNSTGIYNATNLLPGEYQVNVIAPGFAPQQRTGLTLTVGEKQVLNLQLKVGDAATTTFEVTNEAPSVELGGTSVSAVVQGETARELPLNGRDWTQLATLQPGITAIRTQPDPNGLNNRGNRGFGGQLTIAGARPTQNNYRLDGISVNDYANSSPGSSIGLSLGTESIAEFSVISSNYSAAYGLTSGGVVNAMTRAGSNDFHGAAYEFVRNDMMDARGTFDAQKLPFRRNQFGASAGTPIIKSKLFVFANYEGLRQSLTTTTIDTVPSLNARNGNLATSTVKVDPAVSKYLGLFAPPNGTVTGDTGIYSFAGKGVTPENYFTTRVDYTISSRDSIHGMYMLDRGTTSQPDSLNVLQNVNSTRRQVASVEETHVLVPSIVNTFRVGLNRVVAGSLQTAPGANPLGADNTLGVVPGLYAPVIQVTGLTAFGGGLNGTSYGNYWFTTYQLYDDVFYSHGKHSVKFGFSMERIQSNFLLAANPDGVYRFNSISDFLTNKPATFQFQSGTLTPRGVRQSVFGGYAEDDIRLRSNLTLNLGLRYEPSTVPYEVNGKFANLRTLSSPTVYTGGPLFNNPTKHNFEPRAGLAWDPFGNGKTSVHAGFGIFDVLPLTYQFNLAEVSAAPFQSVASSSTLPVGSFPSGAVPLVQAAALLRTTYIQFDPPRNYVMQWNLSIQRELARNLTLMTGYQGSRGLHNAMRSTDANGVIPAFTPQGLLWPCGGTIVNGICSKAATAPKFNPAYGQIDAQEWNGNSYYNALLVSLRRRLTSGLEVQGAFTWSKSIDTSSSVGSGGPFTNSISGQFLFAPLRGLSDYNVSRTFVLSGTWEIPFAKKKMWGGWQLGTILTINDGLPFTATLSGDVLGQGNQSTFDVPNRLNNPGCNRPVNPGDPMHYINLSCFAFPNPSTLLGNGGRNQLIGPGVVNADVSLFKNIPLHFMSEIAHLQFRAEAFNMPNRANYAAPLTNNKLFDNKGAPVNFAGQITTLQTPGRTIQLGLKLLW
ncbi:MAG TPA: carboxypeptidase regulatory-like domain-containing protein [Candidatus Acidoferrum sp.]|nr:carboxypeptidase regulatory-like domain-containing protein [Candidatus Acidoferrum sp.]